MARVSGGHGVRLKHLDVALREHKKLDDWNGYHRHNMGSALADESGTLGGRTVYGEQCHERVRERLYTGTMASGVISDDLVVNNVGVSSEYQSPPHFDVADVGWTAAFAGA